MWYQALDVTITDPGVLTVRMRFSAHDLDYQGRVLDSINMVGELQKFRRKTSRTIAELGEEIWVYVTKIIKKTEEARRVVICEHVTIEQGADVVFEPSER